MNKRFDEQRIAKLCSEHNRQAEDELYIQYAARLYTLCLRYCSNKEDARDLMQESFIKAFESISGFTYKGEGSLYAWISRIAVNMALNELKNRRWRFISLDMLPFDVPDDPPESLVTSIPEEVLFKMIADLPAMKRAVFNMYCIDGYSHTEIASTLGITEKGSASALAKAKAELKKQINKYKKQTETI